MRWWRRKVWLKWRRLAERRWWLWPASRRPPVRRSWRGLRRGLWPPVIHGHRRCSCANWWWCMNLRRHCSWVPPCWLRRRLWRRSWLVLPGVRLTGRYGLVRIAGLRFGISVVSPGFHRSFLEIVRQEIQRLVSLVGPEISLGSDCNDKAFGLITEGVAQRQISRVIL